MRDDQNQQKRKYRRKRWAKRIIVVVLLLGVVMAAVFTLFIQPNLKKDAFVYKEATVQRGRLVVGVTESGYVDASKVTQEYSLDLSVSSDDDENDDDDDETSEQYLKIESMNVAVGQRMNQGDLLFVLTEESIKDVRKSLSYNLSEAAVELSEAQETYSSDALSALYSYESGQMAGELADDKYNLTIDTYQNQIDTLHRQITVTTESLEDAKESLETLLASDSYKKINSDYKSARDTYEAADEGKNYSFATIQEKFLKAKEQYDNQNQRVDSLNKSITEMTDSILKYQEQVTILERDAYLTKLSATQTKESSELTSELAELQYNNKLSSLEETLSEAKTAYEEAKEKLEAFETFVGDGNIYAEYTGLISELNYTVSDYFMTEGAMLSYILEDAYTLSIDVSQEDITNIAVGDTVQIEFKAYPDQSFSGVVSAIKITETSSGTATVSYPVTIQITGDTSKIFESMNADVTFITEEKSDCLYVSRKAITTSTTSSFVYVKDENGEIKEKRVQTGISNGTYIEITSGLEENETVYIKTQTGEE